MHKIGARTYVRLFRVQTKCEGHVRYAYANTRRRVNKPPDRCWAYVMREWMVCAHVFADQADSGWQDMLSVLFPYILPARTVHIIDMYMSGAVFALTAGRICATCN